MYKIIALLSCLLLASCATKSAYISDIDAEKKTSSNSTHLTRITTENKSKDLSTGVAVLVAVDEDKENYIAVAPSGFNSLDVIYLEPSLIRSLSIEEAKELLAVVEFSVKNYDVKVTKLESINASFQSHLQSKIFLFEGSNQLAPRITDILTFTFVNVGRGSQAKIDFGDPMRIKILNKKDLQALSDLLNKAITKVAATT